MKFVLEVDLDEVAGAPADELGRILRYWGGNMHHYDWDEPDQIEPQEIVDTDWKPVGTWVVQAAM